MLTTSCCLKVKNGIIALVDGSIEGIKSANNNIEVEVKEYGVNLGIGNVTIPLPEVLLDYLIENPMIVVYQVGINSYVVEPELVINLDKTKLTEIKGVFHYCQH
jgi:hypothetical protein